MKILREIIIPQETVNDQEVLIIVLYFKEGDFVLANETVLEFETSKAVVAIEAGTDGYIHYKCKENDQIKIGSTAAIIFEDSDFLQKEKEDNYSNQNIEDESVSETLFSLSAELLIKENKIDKKIFSGTDFVNAEKVLSIINKDKKPIPKQVVNTAPEIHDISLYDVEKISFSKKREIEYLSSVQSFGMNSFVTVSVSATNFKKFTDTNLSTLRGSFLPVIIYEVSRLLKKFPKFNAFFDNDNIYYYKKINVGIAVDMEKGLKVLNIRDTNSLSLPEIETGILNISRKYLEDTGSPSDFSDITFTITDLSGFGVNNFYPLINKKNSAILGISSFDQETGKMNLTLTFDHRITEGKHASEFLTELKERLESYASNNNTENSTLFRCYKCMRKSNDTNPHVVFLKVLDKNANEQILCNICFAGY